MDKALLEMVANQIEARGVRDPRVLEAMRTVPRQNFVPLLLKPFAFEDRPLPIGQGQTISQPFIVALMLEAMNLSGDERVLEIGTGSGYQTALLSRLAAEVWSIERIPSLFEKARMALRKSGVKNVHLALGDGFLGEPDQAPFDSIILSAAPSQIPHTLLDQLSTRGGILVAPEGEFGRQTLLRIIKSGSRYIRENLLDVAFVPMLPGISAQE